MIAKKILHTVSPVVVSWARMVFGLPFLAIVLAVSGRLEGIALVSVSPVIVSSIFLTAYMLTWYSAISKAPVTLVSSILVIAPVVTAMLGHKQLNINSVFMLVGIVMIMLPHLMTRKHVSLV